MMASDGRSPYSGTVRKLVVGIDIGTTFSGVSYSILDPGVVPVIHGVNRFPAQESVGGDAKIPSAMYYDSTGSVRAAGAEVMLESNIEKAREQQWAKAEWFKLYLRPKHLKSSSERLPPLPRNKTAVQVFGDFLRYLYDCTRVFIEETHAGGVELFRSLNDTALFVLSHPNGWEGNQQSKMRQAAILAGLISDSPAGRSRVRFVTEGEASIHYCIRNDYVSDMIKGGEGVIIVDAGGGTIDLSAFHLNKDTKQFEEIASTACLFQGSVFISRRARVFLQNMLYNSRYGSPDDIDQITDAFDKSTKLVFKDPNEPAFIKFGTWRDTDETVNVKFGQLKIAGTNVATFFEETIAAIEKAVQEQKDTALVPITSVLLVGGFAASGWLFTNLQSRLRSKGLCFHRPDGHLGKAVADGAVSFVVDHFISARIAKSNFGIKLLIYYSDNNPEHQRRSGTVFTDCGGYRLLPEGFQVILAKGTRVSEITPFRQSYNRRFSDKSELNTVAEPILVYRGIKFSPEWVDEEPDMFPIVCTVTADTRQAVQALSPLVGSCGKYFSFDFDIEIMFGLVEFEAYICWKENGIEKRSPASMVYD